jgi:transcriptional regulator with XRE-family HTH domain
MAIDFEHLGERLRAYRLGSGMSPEEVARRLGISRAALYKYEKGEVIKLDTIERLADLLKVSLPSLLGVGVEYFSNAVSYFERMRQIEAKADQVIAEFEPVSYLVTSPQYAGYLRQMLVEGLPPNLLGRASALAEIDRVMAILEERRADALHRRSNIVSIVGAAQIQRFLRAGLIGTYDLPPNVLAERRQAARAEVERIAALMENEPIGVQIGVVEDNLPNQTFQLFRQRDRTLIAISPFRLGEFPNIRLGVASVTAAEDAVSLYQRLAQQLWTSAQKGPRGAERLRQLLKQPGAKQSVSVAGLKTPRPKK